MGSTKIESTTINYYSISLVFCLRFLDFLSSVDYVCFAVTIYPFMRALVLALAMIFRIVSDSSGQHGWSTIAWAFLDYLKNALFVMIAVTIAMFTQTLATPDEQITYMLLFRSSILAGEVKFVEGVHFLRGAGVLRRMVRKWENCLFVDSRSNIDSFK